MVIASGGTKGVVRQLDDQLDQRPHRRFKCLVNHDGGFDEFANYFTTEELWFPEWEFKGTPWERPDC